jgi:hypothetical protein
MPLAVAGIAAGGSVLGGLIGAGGSKSAAKTQASAAQQAAQLQYAMYAQTAGRLQPWVSTGTGATNQLGGLLGLSGYQASGAGGLGTGALTTPFQPTMAQLSQTPGYQFTLQQGLESVQNQTSAQGQGGGVMPGGGLGASGPEAKGMAQYATGLASTTYQQQFQNYWNQLNNIYNMVSGVSSTGASAAAGVGQAGQGTAANAGNILQAGAGATAAGTVGAANALGGSLSNLGGVAQNYALLSTMQNSPLFGGGTSGSGSISSIMSNAFQGNTLPTS